MTDGLEIGDSVSDSMTSSRENESGRPSPWALTALLACACSGWNAAPTAGDSTSGGGGTAGRGGASGTAASCGVVWGPIADPDSESEASPGDAPDWLGLGIPIDSDGDYPNRTEVRMLSGTGTDDAVEWDFVVTQGRNACVPSKIPVPSHWEFHGFGTFHYGSERRTTEQGIYRRRFDVPESFAGKRVFLVFEGSMTDTTVVVNGRSAGPTHQGAFYRFRYDVTELVRTHASNEIEVTVAKESSDASVNEAERQADYWTFGGIFRPVYLEATPAQAIDRVAIDARADGSLNVDAFLRGVTDGGELIARVFDEAMTPVGDPVTLDVAEHASSVRLSGTFPGIEPWSAERPARYRLAVELATPAGARHALRETFGFRTVEVRAGDGIYVNGGRVTLRGVNRHSFWPDSGRALTRELSVADAEVLKNMNVNAVRCSHYPADRHFYDMADAYGFYVLDELAGWQSPPYDEAVGRKLVEEMVAFNVNHPSILFWDNGNEGGWNTALDGDFGRFDPQGRGVLHPWATFGGINTDHYETYASTVAILGRNVVFLPTEFLHGLYDGGGGAGLEDHWNAMRASPVGAGGFLWAFVDEGVRMPDGRIDVKGNAAPDGVVGPYREKEGSYYTIRELWSPVQIGMQRLPADFDGTIALENHYDFDDLENVRFDWELARFNFAGSERTIDAAGSATTGSVAPRENGALALDLPNDWRNSHALFLSATDRSGRTIGEWSWMLRTQSELRAELVELGGADAVSSSETATALNVVAGDTEFEFSKSSGELVRVRRDGIEFPFGNGPMLAAGDATLASITTATNGAAFTITATYDGDLREVRWSVDPSGWLSLAYRYSLTGTHPYFGVNFACAEREVEGAEWLGKGPSRVWKNRMKGTWHDLWSREKNDAITGQFWEYPEFKGYFADFYWARLRTTAGPVVVVNRTPDLFLRLFTARDGASPQRAAMTFPSGDISFLHGIPGIGDKFLAAADLGPQGMPHELDGETFEAELDFYFGE